MAKKKTKVADRRKAKRHTTSRRPRVSGAGGSGSGGTFGGMRAGFKSLLRSKGRASEKKELSFWNMLTYMLLIAAVAIFAARYAC